MTFRHDLITTSNSRGYTSVPHKKKNSRYNGLKIRQSVTSEHIFFLSFFWSKQASMANKKCRNIFSTWADSMSLSLSESFLNERESVRVGLGRVWGCEGGGVERREHVRLLHHSKSFSTHPKVPYYSRSTLIMTHTTHSLRGRTGEFVFFPECSMSHDQTQQNETIKSYMKESEGPVGLGLAL